MLPQLIDQPIRQWNRPTTRTRFRKRFEFGLPCHFGDRANHSRCAPIKVDHITTKPDRLAPTQTRKCRRCNESPVSNWLHRRDKPLPHIFTSNYPLICVSHPSTRNSDTHRRVDSNQSILTADRMTPDISRLHSATVARDRLSDNELTHVCTER